MRPSNKNTGHPVEETSMSQIPFEPTQEDREKVELLAAVGTRQDLIARMIKNPADGGRAICVRTLTRHFKDELELGGAIANGLVGKTLFDMATSGNQPAATIFWMKCRANWRETNVVQKQNLDRNGNPVDPPSFGISFKNGGPGNAVDVGGSTAANSEGDAELELDEVAA